MKTRPLAIILILCLLVACGGDDGPTDPGGQDSPPSILPPDPDGMLLSGDPADDAATATVNLAPSPAAPGNVAGRLLTTRLAAWIAPGATVEEVNAALADHDAAIVSMVAGVPAVTLVTPAAADRAEAQALAAALLATGAFAHVRPAFTAGREVRTAEAGAARDKDLPEAEVAARIPHALPMRLPAAWNLRAAATDEVALVHPNWYADVPGYLEIPQLAFAGFGQHVPPGAEEYAAGSLGYYMLGVAAADWEYDSGISPHTGTDAAAAEALAVIGVDSYGLDTGEVLSMTALALPHDPSRVVLLDTESFDDPDFEFFRFLDRAWLALQWRTLVHDATPTGGPGFLHVVAAGETRHVDDPYDDAILNSTAGVASLPSLPAVAFLDASVEEYADFNAAYEAAVAQEAAIAEPLPNVLIVGSSDAAGNESSFSAPGAGVRVVGEGVVGPCLVGDQCDGVSMTLDGTAAAAAQVAGLACYLWHLDGTLSLDDLLLRLQHAYSASATPGILDASIAALSVERSGGGVALRTLLLDVDGPDAEPDGAFTEDDIVAFLDAFEAFEGAIAPDYSVYDLNGDGWTGGGGARLDLDGNDLPGFTRVEQLIDGETVIFDENDVTDEEALCYFAHSPLYTGSTAIRRELLGDRCGGGDLVLPGSRMTAEIGLDVEGDQSGDDDSADDSDLVLVTDFGDHAAVLDSTIALGALSATASVHATAALHREPGGVVTLAIDQLAAASVAWPAEDDYARASGEGELHLGLEIVGEHTVTVSGRLSVDAPGEEAGAAIYAHVGPDSTLAGWTFPGSGTWRIYSVDEGILDIEAETATIPEGTHRLWVNLRGDADAGDDSRNVASGTTDATASIEDLLIVLTPADAAKGRVRVLSR